MTQTNRSSTAKPHPMPPASADLATTWGFIKEGMDCIMMRPHTVSFSQYMSLYTVIYNWCTSSRMHGTPDNAIRAGNRTGANSMSSKLYNHLIAYFIAHLRGVKAKLDDLEGEKLLCCYASEWENYRTGVWYISRVFLCLNRGWVQSQRNGGRKNVYPVYTLALMQWKSNVFQNKHEELIGALLGLMEHRRNDEADDQGLVKKVVGSFVVLGLDNNNPEKPSLDVYKEYFEQAFIEATIKYSQTRHGPFLTHDAFSDYLRKAEQCLREETSHAHRYLPEETHKDFAKAFKSLLAQRLLGVIRKSPKWLNFDREEDLRCSYALLSETPEITWLRKRFEEHVSKVGLAAVSKLVGKGKKGADSLDLKAYVDALQEVHRKKLEMVKSVFGGEEGFIASLEKADKDFVNHNAVTGTSLTKSPELLARYTDMLLAKNTMANSADENIEGELNRIMALFRYIDGKDVFLTFYTAKLSERLVHGVSASRELEASMISKLEEACGPDYATKLRSMLTETSLSKDLSDRFRTKQRTQQNRDDLNIKFSIMVLGTSFWPLNIPNDNFIVPSELLRTYNSFSTYYGTEHPKKKLTWLWNYSKNELQTNYLRQRYILRTTSYQMAILLQYNDHDSLSLEQLAVATGINKDTLIKSLSPLVKTRILSNKTTNQYDLNPKFRSRKICVHLHQPVLAEVKVELSELQITINEDRKHAIQAAIVRIMKGRKTMKQEALVQEVISQISQTFTPNVSDIKEAIKTLLDSEYIEQVHYEKDTLAYVA